MLRKKINFKLGKSPTGFLIPGIAIGLLGFLSITALNPMIGSWYANEVYAEGEMTLAATLSPSITLSMASSVSENIEPTVNGSFKNLATVARVQVANSEYYDVSISGDPDMTGVANPDAKVSAISGEKKASEFAANTWGYAASKNAAGTTMAVAATSSTAYKPVPSTSTQIVSRQSTTNNAADDYYSLNFGAKVDTSIPADTYTSRVTLSVTASPVLATEYSLTYDGNGATGGTVPTKQTASSYDENYEFTVVGNTGGLTKTGYTFLGWADSASATTAQYTAGSKVTVSEGSPSRTVYAVWQKNTDYSITYNGNGNTSGTVPAKQTASNINASQEFTVPSDTPTRTDYTFLGWSESNTATEATYTAGSKVTLTSSKPTITLYAVWRDSFSGITTMQQMTFALCKSALENETKQLVDTRDNKTYWVTKLPDGNCWMTQNLDYEISGAGLSIGTKQESDTGKYWEGGLKVMNTPSGLTMTTIDDTWTASTDVDFYAKNGNSAVDGTNKVYDAHYLTGNYYQYSAAPTVCTGMGSQWNLPTSNQSATTNGSFNKLVNGQSTSSDSWILTKPYFFPRAGGVSGFYGSQTNVGSYGYYWSSTPYDTSNGYILYFRSSSVNPSLYSSRYDGRPVRCYVNGN